MKIEVEAYWMNGDPTISVYVGDLHFADIPAVSESKAGHGDDSSYFESEERRVVSESVIAYLRGLASK